MYRFDKKDEISLQSLIHALNLNLSPGAVCVEIGTHIATSACALAQNCPNIKTLYTIDKWLPYSDYLKQPYDGTLSYNVDQKQIEYFKMVAYHHIKYSGCDDKIVVLEMDSNDAVKQFDDDSIDFIFLDAQLSKEQTQNDLDVWYPKLKTGGLFAGHDWFSDGVKEPVNHFRQINNIQSPLSTFDNVFVWRK